MAEVMPSPFVMHGARAVIAVGFSHIAERSDPNYCEVVMEGMFEDQDCVRRHCGLGGTTEHE